MAETHCYIIGKSGTGKSTFLQNDILNNQNGFCLLDPHGDLAEAVADNVDCIYFDPPDISLGFNVLENVPKAQRHLVAANIVSSFKAIWGDSWGPRLEWILYNCLRLLLDNNQSLLDIPTVLTDKTYRTRLLRSASFENFWEQEFNRWDDRFRNDAIAPVLNKVGQLVADPTLNKILAGKTTLKPWRIIAKRQRLVVNLSKGKLGDAPSHLLGALLVSAFYQAATTGERTPFTLYVDEFQNFATDTFASILSEARKFHLQIFLSHQYLGQLPDQLRQAVFGNVSTFTSFRVGAEDAPHLALELGLKNPEMLTDLPPYRAYRRVGGPFNAVYLGTPPPPEPKGLLQLSRNHTRACYISVH
jgi:hypothetical protein